MTEAASKKEVASKAREIMFVDDGTTSSGKCSTSFPHIFVRVMKATTLLKSVSLSSEFESRHNAEGYLLLYALAVIESFLRML